MFKNLRYKLADYHYKKYCEALEHCLYDGLNTLTTKDMYHAKRSLKLYKKICKERNDVDG